MKTLTHEEIYPRGYRTMADVIAHLPHFLEHIYHNQRQRSALHYRSPNSFEAEHAISFASGQITATFCPADGGHSTLLGEFHTIGDREVVTRVARTRSVPDLTSVPPKSGTLKQLQRPLLER